MNDSVPMLGLIAVAVSVVVGLYAFDVAPRQGSIATNRAWWPSYASQPASTSAPSYGNAASPAPAEANASSPQAPSGQIQPQQQAPAPSEPLQYGDVGQSPQQPPQGQAPQGQAPQQQQFGPAGK